MHGFGKGSGEWGLHAGFMPAKTHLKQATGGHVAFDYETQLHIGKPGKLAP